MSPLSGFSDTFRKKAPILNHLSSAVSTSSLTPSTNTFQTASTAIVGHLNNNNNNNNNNTQDKMVETKKPYTQHTDAELADLATQEISLDLHGLIDDSQFTDDNLFGDLMETAKKNDAAATQWINSNGGVGGNTGVTMGRGLTPSSGGSSGQNSPVGGSGGSDGCHGSPLQHQQNSGGYGVGYGNALAYLPGSVHAAGFNQMNPHSLNQNVQVKQEPMESEYSSCAQTPSSTTYSMNTGGCTQSQGVSSTTNYILPEQFSPQSPTSQSNSGGTSTTFPFGTSAAMNTTLATLKSFSTQQQPKYLLQKKKMLPPVGRVPNCVSPLGGGFGTEEKPTEEYRRRRERNNVAVRKSREKAKVRSREVEERVKILARENDRLQKKNELLQEELGVLRSLFSSVGVLPDHVQREVAKHLESFQAQHAAINY